MASLSQQLQEALVETQGDTGTLSKVKKQPAPHMWFIAKTGRVYVTKTSLPRHMRFGKCFENMDAAKANYKSADMKMHLELAALGF